MYETYFVQIHSFQLSVTKISSDVAMEDVFTGEHAVMRYNIVSIIPMSLVAVCGVLEQKTNIICLEIYFSGCDDIIYSVLTFQLVRS